jgi:hypothetical protein
LNSANADRPDEIDHSGVDHEECSSLDEIQDEAEEEERQE